MRALAVAFALLVALQAQAATVAAVGDSQTVARGVANGGWTQLVNADVMSVAEGGTTSADWIGGLYDRVDAVRPFDVLVILLGTNDAFGNVTRETFAANMLELALREPYVVLVTPPFLGPSREIRNPRLEWYREELLWICLGYDSVVCADGQSLMDNAIHLRGDEIHLNDGGHEVYAAEIDPLLVPEPSPIVLLAFGALLLGALRWRS